ncbi:MAG: hypothetical protein V1816_08745 [Pseudomonadota bacterium]
MTCPGSWRRSTDGLRQIVRYVPELGEEGVQDLPPENLCRPAFKMAIGSGKTWVMSWPDRTFTVKWWRDRRF